MSDENIQTSEAAPVEQPVSLDADNTPAGLEQQLHEAEQHKRLENVGKQEEGPAPKKESRSARYQRQIQRLKDENAELRASSNGKAGKETLDVSDVRSFGEPKPPAPERPAPPKLSREQIEHRVGELIGSEPREEDFQGDYLAYDRAQVAYELDKRAVTRLIRSGGIPEPLALPEGTPRHKLSAKEIETAVDQIVGPTPQEQDFDSHAAYERALQGYEIDRRAATREIKGHALPALEAMKAKVIAAIEDQAGAAIYNDRERQLKGTGLADDFDQVMSAPGVQQIEIAPHTATLMRGSPYGPALAYACAKGALANDAEAIETINVLQYGSSEQVAQVIGRFEANFESRLRAHQQPQQPPQQKRVTQAPRPIAPPKGGAAPPSDDARLESFLRKTYPDYSAR
jgi:hypothetical protein